MTIVMMDVTCIQIKELKRTEEHEWFHPQQHRAVAVICKAV